MRVASDKTGRDKGSVDAEDGVYRVVFPELGSDREVPLIEKPADEALENASESVRSVLESEWRLYRSVSVRVRMLSPKRIRRYVRSVMALARSEDKGDDSADVAEDRLESLNIELLSDGLLGLSGLSFGDTHSEDMPVDALISSIDAVGLTQSVAQAICRANRLTPIQKKESDV